MNLTSQLHSLRNPSADTAFQQKYVGTPLPVLGVRVDDLRALAKATVAAHKAVYAPADWLALLDDLYLAGPTFEHRLLAAMILHSLPALRRDLNLARLRSWIAAQQGWAAIDTTCQNGWSAAELLARWPEWQPFLDGLSVDPYAGLRRASLVLLNAPLRESPDTRLRDQAFAAIDRLKPERDPLIAKAASWSLRTLIKHHPDDVRAFLAANEADLPKVTLKEVRSKLETGKK